MRLLFKTEKLFYIIIKEIEGYEGKPERLKGTKKLFGPKQINVPFSI